MKSAIAFHVEGLRAEGMAVPPPSSSVVVRRDPGLVESNCSERRSGQAVLIAAEQPSKCLTAKLAKAAKAFKLNPKNPKSFASLAPFAVRYSDTRHGSLRNAAGLPHPSVRRAAHRRVPLRKHAARVVIPHPDVQVPVPRHAREDGRAWDPGRSGRTAAALASRRCSWTATASVPSMARRRRSLDCGPATGCRYSTPIRRKPPPSFGIYSSTSGRSGSITWLWTSAGLALWIPIAPAPISSQWPPAGS